MKKMTTMLCAAGLVLAAATAQAQPLPTDSPASASATADERYRADEESWYRQRRRLAENQAANAVRQNAEFEAQQRRERMAARKWFGYSNLRPVVNSTPWGTTYSPRWTPRSTWR